MNVQTPLANTLDNANYKSSYNDHAIKILSNPYILAYIMQGTVSECQNMSIPEIIATIDGPPEIKSIPVHPDEIMDEIIGTKNEDIVPGEGRTFFDIRFHAYIPGAKQNIKILLNIEAQKDYSPGYDIVTRGIYYGARMISSQRGKEFKKSNYNDIKKIYSLWICTNTPNYAKNTVTAYKLKQEKIFGDFQGNPRYDILNVIFICLGDPNDKEIPQFLSMLSTTLNDYIPSETKKSVLQNDFNIPMTQEFRKEIDEMCNLADAIEERGIKRASEDNARRFFENNAPFELVRASIEILTDEELQTIYNEVKTRKQVTS